MKPATSPPAAQPAKSSRAVYVLDDEPEVCAFIDSILSDIGFSVRTFSRASDMELALALEMPSVLIVDLSLGQSDAVEVIRNLTKTHFAGKLLLISGRHDPVTIDRVREIGKQYGFTMLPFLQKPFRIAELKARLTTASKSAAPLPQTETELALRNNWLELWYQPKIDLKTRLIFGAEALVRLRHPQKGVLLPSEFLPPPGDPLHRPLANFVLRRAFADWPAMAVHQFKFRLAVNMPVSVFEGPEFVANLRKYLPADPKFPGMIVELIEDEVIRDPDFASEIATQLRLYNIEIAIDDFGSKYSSLERLNQLPFTELKIDRKYVQGCYTDRQKYDFCRGIVALGHRMNMTVIGEGVETADDIRALVAMQCDGAQGFAFAKPMEKAAFLKTLLSRAVAEPVA